MPRLTDSVPKYRKHRASGQAIVTLCGRDHYLGPHNTKASRVEYDRLIAEWLAAGRGPLYASAATLSVAELCLRYLTYAEARYVKNGRPTSEVGGLRVAIRYVRRLYSRQPITEFGPLSLKAVRNCMVADNLAISSINQHVGRIRRVFRWGVAEELVPSSVYEALSAVDGLRRYRGEARETEPVRPVDDETVDATLPHLPEIVADMVRFQRLTGCRPAEVCLLRPGDVDRSTDVWLFTPSSHKTEHHGRNRVIPIGPNAQGILLRYLARDSEAYCFVPKESERRRRAAQSEVRVVPMSCGTKPGDRSKRRPKRQAGVKYRTDVYRRAITRACDRAFPAPQEILDDPEALAKWRREHRWAPNQLRHSAGTRIRRDFGVEGARAVLGHSKISTTEIYAEKDLGQAIRIAAAIG